MRRFAFLFVLAFCLRADVFVSPAGSDSNPGTEAAPVRTLEQARDLLRRQGGGVAWLRGGAYQRTSTFALAAEDSNTIWRSYPGEEARITGARAVTGFTQLPDRPGLWRADLKAQGITDYGKLQRRGMGLALRASPLELIYRGQPMRLAEWPDIGWAYTKTVALGEFSFEGERAQRWAAEPELWVHGYWTYDWADSYERVRELDPASSTLRTEAPHGVYGYTAGRRFRVVNAFSELDTPGEYWIDRQAGILFFYPPAPLHDGDTQVTLLESPLVTITGGRNIHLLDLTLENSRGTAVEIRGGAEVVVGWSRLQNLGMRAVSVDGGAGNGVEYCDIRDTGEGALSLTGGDRRTLTPSGHFATGNRITRFSRWVRTYRPAIQISGAGIRVMENYLHHAPHEAIMLAGNDHWIDGNDIHTVAWETADVGAFYMGRDWTWQGNVLRRNFFHNQGNGDVNSVYLDDCASGTLIEENFFERAGRSVFIGGGRNNTVRNNVFVDGSPSLEVDARGLTWGKTWFNGKDNTLMDRLAEMPYKTPPWSERYPALVNILDDEPAVPKGNIVEGNKYFGSRWTRYRDGTEKWVAESGTEQLTEPPQLPAKQGSILNYRLEAIAGQSRGARLVIENLGAATEQGELLVWTWPGAVKLGGNRPVSFRLEPGDKLERVLDLEGWEGYKDVWAGLRLAGEDLRPLALKLAPK